MNDKWRDQITLDIIVAMNTALVNLRLYPPTSSMIINTIERLHQTLQGFFAGAPALVLGEADKVLLIGDQPLSRKDLERPPIAAFLEVILNFGIKSITIGSDVTREDLSAFLEILGEKPVTISREGGLAAVMAARQVGHILIDEKIYIAKDSKQQILARLDIDDEVVVRYLTGGEGAAGADLDIQQLQDLAKDPDWLENVFKQGLNQIMGKRDTLPIGQLSANMVRMLGILDKVIDRADQEKFVRMIAKSIADLDVDMIGCILSRPLDTIFDGRLFGEVVAAIDEAKFEQVAARMAGMKGGRDALGAGAGIGGVGVGAGGVGGAAGGVSAASPGAAGVMGGAAPGAGVGGPGTAAFGAIPPPSAAAAPGAAGAARYAAPASGAAAAPGYAAPSAAAPAPGFAAGAASGAAAASGFASRTPPSAAPQYAAPPSTTSPSTTSPSATPPSGASGVPGVSAVPPAVPEAYRRLMETEKGRQLRERAEAERLRAEDEKSRKLATLKEKISPLLQGREECFLDEALMCSMADIVGELAAQEGPETTDAVLDRLAEALRSDRQDVRDQAAAALAQILDRLPERRRQEELNRLADRLRAWIEKETVATTAYRKLCHLLKDLISLRIGDGEYREALPLLQLFHRIDYGLLEKNETAQEIAMDIIRGLSTPERLDFLFDRYERLTGEDEEQKDVGRLLAHLGEGSLARLMDILREHTNSDERVKVLHLFIEIGRPVLAIIKNEIHLDRPWYFHRNLAYLLGWIKGETTVESLRALLLHKHDKVRQEALTSLAKVGGGERGPVLLETLPAVDGAFKLELIDRLGRMKYREATPVFLAMMKERPFIVTPARIDLEEALCTALGRIGDPAALSMLNEISNPGFFTVTTYHKKVKIAASQALNLIGRN